MLIYSAYNDYYFQVVLPYQVLNVIIITKMFLKRSFSNQIQNCLQKLCIVCKIPRKHLLTVNCEKYLSKWVAAQQSFHSDIHKNAKSISAIDQIDKKSAIATQ